MESNYERQRSFFLLSPLYCRTVRASKLSVMFDFVGICSGRLFQVFSARRHRLTGRNLSLVYDEIPMHVALVFLRETLTQEIHVT